MYVDTEIRYTKTADEEETERYAKTMNTLTATKKAEDHASADTGMIRDQTVPLLRTPATFKAHRQMSHGYIQEKGKEFVLFDAEGPGCLRHFWISTDCAGDGLRIRIHVDDAEQPQVDMELNHFFGILLDKKPYNVESPGIQVLPLGSRNCYLPIPFVRSCRITLHAGDIKGKVKPFDWEIIDDDPKSVRQGVFPGQLAEVRRRSESNSLPLARPFPRRTTGPEQRHLLYGRHHGQGLRGRHVQGHRQT